MIETASLHRLRLRTPRLELRLGSEVELQELGRLAQRGIHPPEEMPFAVAWSDAIGEPNFLDSFVSYHETRLAAWTPEDWRLNLLVWADAELVGTQSLAARSFSTQRTVATGSWLGSAFQRQGYGTEMRAAVLELAFRGLDANAATSGWLEGNAASARVSERLGYRETGTGEIAPRGTPVVHHDVRLERSDWRAPFPVEIEELTLLLPLFGISS